VKKNKVLLSLGSNVGDRIDNINAAVELLSEVCFIEKKNVSSFYETEPFGNRNQNYFINIAVIAETDLSPENLLFICKTIEFELGRKHAPLWAERPIDIDVLLFNNIILNIEKFTIPHKFLHLRKFVLVPATEIARNFIHPILNKSIAQLNDLCQDTSNVIKQP
jgi:2-amino-4-hydroxy-6-hydroxymethyldihydropteridine diphosphokinase